MAVSREEGDRLVFEPDKSAQELERFIDIMQPSQELQPEPSDINEAVSGGDALYRVMKTKDQVLHLHL